MMLPIIEVAFGVYVSCCIGISIYYGFGRASAPFLSIFALSSVVHPWYRWTYRLSGGTHAGAGL